MCGRNCIGDTGNMTGDSFASGAQCTPLQFERYGVVFSESERQYWYEQRTRQAQSAFEHGQSCLKRGDSGAGLFWLGRAERLAGNNAHVVLSYAMTAFAQGLWAEALRRFGELQQRFQLREVAFATVMCLYRLGRVREAVQELANALSRYPITEEFHALASEFAWLHGVEGWASLSNTGQLVVRSPGSFCLSLDDQSLGVFSAGVHHLSDANSQEASEEGAGIAPYWFRGSHLSVHVGGQHVLGSPFDIAAITRCESLVYPLKDGVRGWLWYPAEPHFRPSVFMDGSSMDVAGQIAVTEDGGYLSSEHPVWHPYSFFVPFEALPDHGHDAVMLRDGYGRPLLGAPLDPGLGRLLAGQKPFPAHLRPVPVRVPQEGRLLGNSRFLFRTGGRKAGKTKNCVVVIPVYRDHCATMACLKSVLATVPANVEVIVVDDATPELSLAQSLDQLATEGQITLLRHKENLGFPASVNHALRSVGPRDAILLNSDTIVFEGWVERLRAWLCHEHVGTVTPFSNSGGLSSYPSAEGNNPCPTVQQARKLDMLCQSLVDDRMTDLPTANGFCMAISSECLVEIGLFREDIFAQGYGEENDFCLRASIRGFRHVVATNVYVRHLGGASFQQGREGLLTRNLEILNALHPGYDQLIQFFKNRDPLKIMRRRLDQGLLEAWRLPDGKDVRTTKKPAGSVVMIRHNAGGGVARSVRERAGHYMEKGYLPLSLRPSVEGIVLELCGHEEVLPNLHFALPTEGGLLVALLRRLNVQWVEWHHLLGHAPWVRRLHRFLDVAYDVFIHDHIWFCPRIVLLDKAGHYCGEPDLKGCEACLSCGDVAEEGISLPDLLARSAKEFGNARRVVVSCPDSARRIRRHIQPCPSLVIEPWENDRLLVSPPPKRSSGSVRRRIGIIGGISVWKGYNILKELGHYIQDKNLPVELVIVGSTENDDDLMAAGIQVTGMYKDEEVLNLVKKSNFDFAFIPSIAPETWCYALGWVWRAGLEAVCFDIGAVAERVRSRGRGFVLPLGLPVGRLAEFLLSYRP